MFNNPASDQLRDIDIHRREGNIVRIGSPKLIYNPYDWLPIEGESKVSFRSEGMDAVLEISYERNLPPLAGDEGDIDEQVIICRREIRFKRALYFVKIPFPGFLFFKYDENSEKPTVGALTEFLYSEFAQSSADVFKSLSGNNVVHMRHFSIQFLSENVGFHILSEDISLSEELCESWTGCLE